MGLPKNWEKNYESKNANEGGGITSHRISWENKISETEKFNLSAYASNHQPGVGGIELTHIKKSVDKDVNRFFLGISFNFSNSTSETFKKLRKKAVKMMEENTKPSLDDGWIIDEIQKDLDDDTAYFHEFQLDEK